MITLTPELEARLREVAAREGRDLNAVAQSLMKLALAWDAREHAESVAAIQEGLDDAAAGRVRPLAEFDAAMRAKHNISQDARPLTDEELDALHR